MSEFSTTCPLCAAKFKSSKDLTGKHLTCPQCGHSYVATRTSLGPLAGGKQELEDDLDSAELVEDFVDEPGEPEVAELIEEYVDDLVDEIPVVEEAVELAEGDLVDGGELVEMEDFPNVGSPIGADALDLQQPSADSLVPPSPPLADFNSDPLGVPVGAGSQPVANTGAYAPKMKTEPVEQKKDPRFSIAMFAGGGAIGFLVVAGLMLAIWSFVAEDDGPELADNVKPDSNVPRTELNRLNIDEQIDQWTQKQRGAPGPPEHMLQGDENSGSAPSSKSSVSDTQNSSSTANSSANSNAASGSDSSSSPNSNVAALSRQQRTKSTETTLKQMPGEPWDAYQNRLKAWKNRASVANAEMKPKSPPTNEPVPKTYEGRLARAADYERTEVYVSFDWEDFENKSGWIADGPGIQNAKISNSPSVVSNRFSPFAPTQIAKEPLDKKKGYELTKVDLANLGIPWQVDQVQDGKELIHSKSETGSTRVFRLRSFASPHVPEDYEKRRGQIEFSHHQLSRVLWSASGDTLFVMSGNPEAGTAAGKKNPTAEAQGPRRLLKINPRTWEIEKRVVPGLFHIDDIGRCPEGLLCLISDGATSGARRMRAETSKKPLWFPILQGKNYGSVLAVLDEDSLEVKKAWSLPRTHRIAGSLESNYVRTLYNSRYSATLDVSSGEVIDLDRFTDNVVSLQYSDDGKRLWWGRYRQMSRYTSDASIMTDLVTTDKSVLGFTPDYSEIVMEKKGVPTPLDFDKDEDFEEYASSPSWYGVYAFLPKKHQFLAYSSNDGDLGPMLKLFAGDQDFQVHFQDSRGQNALPMTSSDVKGKLLKEFSDNELHVSPDERGVLVVNPSYALWVESDLEADSWPDLRKRSKQPAPNQKTEPEQTDSPAQQIVKDLQDTRAGD
ncbi:MAG: hypothetical protein AAF483_21990, partial [Planctomycetota bacterium]